MEASSSGRGGEEWVIAGRFGSCSAIAWSFRAPGDDAFAPLKTLAHLSAGRGKNAVLAGRRPVRPGPGDNQAVIPAAACDLLRQPPLQISMLCLRAFSSAHGTSPARPTSKRLGLSGSSPGRPTNNSLGESANPSQTKSPSQGRDFLARGFRQVRPPRGQLEVVLTVLPT